MAPSDPQGAGPAPERPAARRGRRLWVGLGLLAALGLALVAWQWWEGHGQPGGADGGGDAPPAFTSPFLNTAAGVKSVGDDACVACHESYVKSFHAHPMGRSLTPVGDWAGPERYDEKAGNPFPALGYVFRVERDGRRVVHHETPQGDAAKAVGGISGEVRFVIGSARQGSSYLVERDGFLTQSPVSWFAHKDGRGGWGLSPGFVEGSLHFDRPVTFQCLFCHADPPAPVEGTVNRYHSPLTDTRPIGCERCHGPGELHVRSRQRPEPAGGEVDYTIVNPRHLEPILREAVCEQCHLQGEARIVRRDRSLLDYRPGLPLHQYLSVYVRPPEASQGRAIGHVEQMHLSRCYRASNGRLGCISCHDPHALPAPDERVGFYRGRCLGCHAETSCRLTPAARRAQNPADSCIDCHMPHGPTRNVAHLSFTDHRIVRRSDRPPPVYGGVPPGGVPLIHFHRDQVGGQDGDGDRDLALAMITLARNPCPDPVRRQICSMALTLLDRAGRRRPEDVAMTEARGYALGAVGRPAEALAALDEALAGAPRREVALETAGQVAVELGEWDAAAGYWTRLVDVNPWRPPYHTRLAAVLVKRRDWQRGLEECRAALRLDPTSVPVRRLLITCLLAGGDKGQARAEFDRLMALNPPDREGLKEWFDRAAR
jgi:tetratricopeptide (TPR) repeat protein